MTSAGPIRVGPHTPDGAAEATFATAEFSMLAPNGPVRVNTRVEHLTPQRALDVAFDLSCDAESDPRGGRKNINRCSLHISQRVESRLPERSCPSWPYSPEAEQTSWLVVSRHHIVLLVLLQDRFGGQALRALPRQDERRVARVGTNHGSRARWTAAEATATVRWGAAHRRWCGRLGAVVPVASACRTALPSSRCRMPLSRQYETVGPGASGERIKCPDTCRMGRCMYTLRCSVWWPRMASRRVGIDTPSSRAAAVAFAFGVWST